MLIDIGTWKISKNKMFSYIGLIYGFIGIINLGDFLFYLNIISYTDMVNKAYQLWTFASYYQSISICSALYFMWQKINLYKSITINLIIIILALVSIFIFPIFPRCFIEGIGMTNFKFISEFIIIGLNLYYIYFLYKNDEVFLLDTRNILKISMIFNILSELSFCFSTHLYDFMNFIAHINKGISFYLLYKALFLAIVINPYETIFNKLNKKAEDLEKANITIENESMKYRKILDFLPSGIVKKENNKIVYINRMFKEMFQVNDINELLDEDFEFINCDKHQITDLYDSVEKNKYFIDNTEHEFLIDNKKLTVDIASLCMYEKKLKSCITVIKDIGYKKKTEEILATLKEKEKADELKNQFFANISHELRTPINVIYTALQMEKIFLQNNDLSSLEKYNYIINQNCLRLIRLVNNIIDSNKIEAGFMEPTLNVFNIVDLVENITQSIISYAEYKKIKVIFDTDTEEVYVLCDLDYIERIMLNLLSNAIKYSNEGCTIEIIISTNKSGKVLILIKDDGIGISQDNQIRIFHRFEKVDKSISRETEGSGIGLYITNSLVESQNGTISLESTLGKGSSFFIEFPVVDEYNETILSTNTNKKINTSNISEKINIEFSDIYFK
jgi:signal transduction histidine kinase